MQSSDITVLTQASKWLQEGFVVWLATVLRTYGSSPRQPGAMCAFRADGVIIGSVSGGCIEEDLRDRLQAGEFAADAISFKVYGESIEDRDRFSLPCGGTLRLAMEKLSDTSWLAPVLDALTHRQSVKRVISISNLTSNVYPTHSQDVSVNEAGNELSFVYGPRARLLLIGAGETSRYLAKMALALDFQVLVADPREEMQQVWDEQDGELLRMMPDDAVIAIQPDSSTSIITLTHDPKLDDMALLEALKSEAYFIGALGSTRTNAKRRERLAMFDLTPEQINRLYGPVGLDIGSKTPAEIAIAILAQLVQLKASNKHHRQESDIRLVS